MFEPDITTGYFYPRRWKNHFSNRTINALRSANITNDEMLKAIPRDRLLMLQCFGTKALREVDTYFGRDEFLKDDIEKAIKFLSENGYKIEKIKLMEKGNEC